MRPSKNYKIPDLVFELSFCSQRNGMLTTISMSRPKISYSLRRSFSRGIYSAMPSLSVVATDDPARTCEEGISVEGT
jgi:ABC-type tungstate transport system permease subunit